MTDQEFEQTVRRNYEETEDQEMVAFWAIAVALVDLKKSIARDTERIMSKLNLIAGNLKNG